MKNSSQKLGITGFNLKVKEMTKTVFSEELKKNPKLLDDYSMIVNGICMITMVMIMIYLPMQLML